MSDTPNPPAPATPQADGKPDPKPPQTPPAEPPKNPADAPKPGDGDAKPTAPANPPAPPKVVPEKYDLKLPEGSQLDAAHVEKVSSFAKEHKLSNEEAQAIIDRDNANIASYADGQNAKLKERQEAWKTESSTDKEYGGEAFAQNAELAKRVIQRFGSDALKTALNDTGLGNHPELLRVFVRIGKAMSEDQLVLPKNEAGGGKKSMEEVFYGEPQKEQ